MVIKTIKINNEIYDLTTDLCADISTTKDEIADLRNHIYKLEELIAELRSAPDAKTENPKQKDDLEIFNRIVLSDDFLKLEGNIFLS